VRRQRAAARRQQRARAASRVAGDVIYELCRKPARPSHVALVLLSFMLNMWQFVCWLMRGNAVRFVWAWQGEGRRPNPQTMMLKEEN